MGESRAHKVVTGGPKYLGFGPQAAQRSRMEDPSAVPVEGASARVLGVFKKEPFFVGPVVVPWGEEGPQSTWIKITFVKPVVHATRLVWRPHKRSIARHISGVHT